MANDNELPILVLASSNAGKLRELQELVGQAATVVSAFDLHVVMPEETETSFAGNARLKSQAAFAQTGHISLADDSGLEVDALNGAPGVYSARYAGEHATDADNNAKLLTALLEIPADERTARFRSAIAITDGVNRTLVFDGVCEGSIGFEPSGDHGFGYDPLFVLPGGRTMAALTSEEKNTVSHRGNAMRAALPTIRRLIADRQSAS